MPFESQAQRRFMYATDPKMARRFEKKTKKKKLPEKVKKSPIDIAFRLLKDATHGHDFEDTDDDVQEYFDTEIRPLVLNPKTPRPFAMMSHKILQDKIKPFSEEGIQPDEEMSDLLDEYNFRYVENDPEMRGSPVSNRGFSREFQDANKSEPMDIAMRLLKRQTTLGEFHPDFPSPYGPVTMVRQHPTMEWANIYGNMIDEGFDNTIHQPYETLITQGLHPQVASLDSVLWEDIQDSYDKVKPFDLTGKGTWFYPSGVSQDRQTVNNDARKMIGVRIPLNELEGQFRNKGFMGEPPEAWIQQYIPPERLTQIPNKFWTGTKQNWGKRGK